MLYTDVNKDKLVNLSNPLVSCRPMQECRKIISQTSSKPSTTTDIKTENMKRDIA